MNTNEKAPAGHEIISLSPVPLEVGQMEPENVCCSCTTLDSNDQLEPILEQQKSQETPKNMASPKNSVEKEANRKQVYEVFLAEIAQVVEAEEKLRKVIEFMSASLATKQGTPFFKGFWDARLIALQLFKENITPIVRTELWTKYSELSKEARRLKEILDEQSAFASEQIEMTIKAIEHEQENFESLFQDHSIDPVLSKSEALKANLDYYSKTQRKLQLLSAHATRITALRKELIRTEMRVRYKNKFFQRLSAAGDKTFPLRKDLIKELSDHFNHDIDVFVQQHFSTDNFHNFNFFLREEIKILQMIAKYLTLNTQSFTYTRMRLSECWDKLKNSDKERKRQRAQDRAQSRENAEVIHKKLLEIEEQIQSNFLSGEKVYEQLDQIFNELRHVELSKEEFRSLRDHLSSIRKPLIEKEKAAEQERLHQAQEREKLRKFRIQELKNEITALLADLESNDADQLAFKRDNFIEKIADVSASKIEKQEIERLLKPIKDAIVDRKERAILDLPDNERQALSQLKEVLEQRRERRQEIKKQLEMLRKSSGSSGLDFEKAMNVNAQLEAEKERFEKISEGVKEIEEKIAEILKNKNEESA